MTNMDHPVSRKSCSAYRISVTGAVADPTGVHIVASMHGSPATGDWLTIREAGRSTGVTYDIAGLYQQGLVRRAKLAKAMK